MAVLTRNNIVTNGLVLNLDSLNPQSIPLDPTVNNILNQSTYMSSTHTSTICSISWSQADSSYYLTFKSGSTAVPYKGIQTGNGSNYVLEPTSSRVTYSFKAQAITTNVTMGIDINNYPLSGSSTSNDNRITSQDVYFPNGSLYNLLTTSSAQTFYVQYTVQTGSANFTGSYYRAFNNFFIPNDTVINQDITIRCWDFQHELSTYPTPYTPTSRSVWYDMSGNGNNAQLLGNARPIPKYNSLNERILNFDGTGSYAQVNSNILQDSGGTINTWVYPKGLSAASYIFAAFGTNSDRYYLGINSNSTLYVSRGNPLVRIDSPVVPLNAWYNLVLTWNSSSMSGYLNGTFLSSSAYVASGSTSLFTIGSYLGGSQLFYGNISTTQIYNRPLSQAEIIQNFNATKTRFGLS